MKKKHISLYLVIYDSFKSEIETHNGVKKLKSDVKQKIIFCIVWYKSSSSNRLTTFGHKKRLERAEREWSAKIIYSSLRRCPARLRICVQWFHGTYAKLVTRIRLKSCYLIWDGFKQRLFIGESLTQVLIQSQFSWCHQFSTSYPCWWHYYLRFY